MINNDYLVDMSWCDSGGYCDFMPIRGEDKLGFKSFKTKKGAEASIDNQLILAKFNLAPQVITKACKIPYSYDPELLKYWTPEETVTPWGYVTEKAITLDEQSDISYYKIQDLVDQIRNLTGLKFWDCHHQNLGLIKRNTQKILVCIDTGQESFTPYCNAWGFLEPGPKCPYCNNCQCYCSTNYKDELCHI